MEEQNPQNQEPQEPQTQTSPNDESLNIHLPLNQIRSMVQSLYDKLLHDENKFLTEVDLKVKFREEYKELELRYPALYNMVLEQRHAFDWNEFNHLMSRIETIRQNPNNFDKESVAYGQRAYNRYVKPKLDKK
jgi:hypothetical protein